ncbi:MAG TPA: succinate dehydrogenase, cytochrome b556 subunit [Lysobacter sp.]|nr:succinate dehydrogenase, cytochrome b556 subunit [Lysobacter sp.]
MATRERPLSPHLSIYRWQVQMVSSILHRATGIVLSLGALLIAWALLALADGPEAWGRVVGFFRSPLGFLVLFGWVWSLAYHFCNGIRHLLQDAGFGYRIESFVRSSWASVIGSLVLTAVVFLVAMTQRGGA